MLSWTKGIASGFATSALLLTAGCGRQAIASTDALPVHRVVVYRNGVAYFERAGHVDKDEVRFKMKQTEVGDFLATLAVMERGGSSVRAAVFPLKMDDDNEGAKPATGDEESSPGSPRHGLTDDEKKGLQTVVLALDGRDHDLQVGYVAESPVWKPSYRLVVHSEGDADLQAWGIVENLSGEDWTNVKLSLIAGAPLAFEASLGIPVIPPRPMVTDQGEVIAAVPHGETTLRQEAPTMAAANAAAEKSVDAEQADEPSPAGVAAGRGAPSKATASRIAKKRAALRPFSPAPAPPSAAPEDSSRETASPSTPALSPPRSLRSLAAVAVEGGTTRYDLPLPVTIPDKTATMVMLLSRRVAGEALFLFAPDGGVPDSASHPFRVARFTNASEGALERGPIAVFEQGAFLGQGVVDPLPAGATATVPFALERSLAIDVDRKFDEQGARLAKIENGELTVERDRVTQTKYRVRNGADLPAKLLVKHPRMAGARLFEPPKGTEDNVGTGAALVPTTIAPHATGELLVDERVTERQAMPWFNPFADSAIKAYLADPKANGDVVRKLSVAWTIRNDVVKKREERSKLQQESDNLSRSTEETRRNLHAIEKNKTADALRQKLTARLADAASRLDDLNRKIVDLDSKLAELTVQFDEAVRELKVTT
jgi:hypothetical protein